MDSEPEPSGITNRHRLDYVLDLLAEPFPEKAKLVACACGAKGQGGPLGELKAQGDSMLSKRDLIEGALLEALGKGTSLGNPDPKPNEFCAGRACELRTKPLGFLEAELDAMNNDQVGKLLKLTPIPTIDIHLRDMALFLDPERGTTFNEVKDWDLRHRNDFK